MFVATIFLKMDEENTTTTVMAGAAAGADDLSDLTSSRVQPLKRAVPVPSTDLRAALSAIQTNAASLHIRLNDDSLTERERMELEAKIAANGSLRDHIARLCRPSSDTVHEETLQKVREELRGGGSGQRNGRSSSADNDNDVDDDASDDSSVWDDVDDEEGFTTDDDDEEEVDESDLIDQNTLRKVRELRETVRTISNRVNDKMADVTGRAVQLAEKEVEGMRDLGGKMIAGDGEDEEEGTAAADPFSDDAELSSTNAAKIATMQSTLTSLSESVAKIETASASTDEEGNGGNGASLPTAVSDLQSTVDTVAAALAKARLRREEGDDAILSQTERAILSKPEKEGGAAGGIGDADGDIRAAEARARIAGMDPQERFAVFMTSSANGGGGNGGTGAV